MYGRPHLAWYNGTCIQPLDRSFHFLLLGVSVGFMTDEGMTIESNGSFTTSLVLSGLQGGLGSPLYVSLSTSSDKSKSN